MFFLLAPVAAVSNCSHINCSLEFGGLLRRMCFNVLSKKLCSITWLKLCGNSLFKLNCSFRENILLCFTLELKFALRLGIVA